MAASKDLAKATVLFAGDSGDGMQLTGGQFTQTTALSGNDLNTFPDFPAEIRAPAGTVPGVSGFKIHFGSAKVYTAGDQVDTLVAMNAAALSSQMDQLKKGGLIIANSNGMDARNLRLAGLQEDRDLLGEAEKRGFEVVSVEITRLTKEALKDSPLSNKDKDRAKNMFTLGLVYWLYDRELERTERFLKERFADREDIQAANLKALRAGHHYGETTELFRNRFSVPPADLPPGRYRNIKGNQALSIGLIAAAHKSGLDLFYAGYPITPASDILHEMAGSKAHGVQAFQAEDEIAAITSAIGAAFGGALAVTASSGPGIALKTEALGLAVMLELPLVVINVQRGGPSTGLPTKTEQSDLGQALFGRNGEAPLPVLSCASPKDAFDVGFEACKMALEHMTPVMILSDGYIANGSEPWKFPSTSELPNIQPPLHRADDGEYVPYKRDEKGVRKWAVPGTLGAEHRIGGLEKQAETGHVSYDSENHQQMVRERKEKVERIAQGYSRQEVSCGSREGGLLVISWGSTYGAVRTAVERMHKNGISVGQYHLRHLHPLPSDLGDLIERYDQWLVPELNEGQLLQLIRSTYLVDAKGLNKVQGVPFTHGEVEEAIGRMIDKRE